jgi:hypothetical protein
MTKSKHYGPDQNYLRQRHNTETSFENKCTSSKKLRIFPQKTFVAYRKIWIRRTDHDHREGSRSVIYWTRKGKQLVSTALLFSTHGCQKILFHTEDSGKMEQAT